jgi:lysyl-tRNA synthetase class II
VAEYDGRLEGGEEDEASDVAVAGRIMTRRVFGSLAFFTLQDESGTIQLQFDKKRLGDGFKVRFLSICVTSYCAASEIKRHISSQILPSLFEHHYRA